MLTLLNNHIHIVCPEIPHPLSTADMADTWFQLQLLHKAGLQVILHCFHDDNGQPADLSALQDITFAIHLYERNQGHKGLSIRHPYCISSRSNPLLLQNLLQLNAPVLFQGMAATYCLPELVENGYKTFVRLNGIKSALYDASVKCEKSLLKKAFSFNEARLIRKWEEKITAHASIITSTPRDQHMLEERYPGSCIKYIPLLIPLPAIDSKPGSGMYCLYYGDMSDPENEKIVQWLGERIFSKIPVPLVVADTGTAARTAEPAHHESNICMISQPDEPALKDLIEKAQVIILPRCHQHGFDTRLITALEKGRHCVCNDLMVMDTGLEKCFIVASDCGEMKSAVMKHFSRPFTQYDINERTHLLSTAFFVPDAFNELLRLVDQQ